MEDQVIQIPEIQLKWYDWQFWPDIAEDARSSGIYIPNGTPGVYEAKHITQEERLTIGKTTNLRYRVRQCLVKGNGLHSAGTKIRDNEHTDHIEVRWAETDRPAAVEEELHRLHKLKFGRLPKYTDH